MDKGAQVYVDQPQVGSSLGLLSVHQQVTNTGHWSVTLKQGHHGNTLLKGAFIVNLICHYS